MSSYLTLIREDAPQQEHSLREVFLYPFVTIAVLLLIVDVFALIIGIMQVILAFRVCNWSKTSTPHVGIPRTA